MVTFNNCSTTVRVVKSYRISLLIPNKLLKLFIKTINIF